MYRDSRRVSVEVDSGTRMLMGTFARVVVIARSERAGQACIEAAFDVQDRIESLMSYHRADSELNKVNRLAATEPVPVNPMTFEVLRHAIRFSELSNGTFDVTVGPLVDLWHAAGDANEPPSEEALAEARRKVGFKKLILDEKAATVRFAEEGMRIDLGGIAKGYAVDKAVEAMRKKGALGGMVDLGATTVLRTGPSRTAEMAHRHPGPRCRSRRFRRPEIPAGSRTGGRQRRHQCDYRRFAVVRAKSKAMFSHPVRQRSRQARQRHDHRAGCDHRRRAVHRGQRPGAEAGLALIDRLPSVEAIVIPGGGATRLLSVAGRTPTSIRRTRTLPADRNDAMDRRAIHEQEGGDAGLTPLTAGL